MPSRARTPRLSFEAPGVRPHCAGPTFSSGRSPLDVHFVDKSSGSFRLSGASFMREAGSLTLLSPCVVIPALFPRGLLLSHDCPTSRRRRRCSRSSLAPALISAPDAAARSGETRRPACLRVREAGQQMRIFITTACQCARGKNDCPSARVRRPSKGIVHRSCSERAWALT